MEHKMIVIGIFLLLVFIYNGEIFFIIKLPRYMMDIKFFF